MHLVLSELAGGDVLAGAANGSAILSRLISLIRATTAPTVVALDFAGVTVATGSFLRECVLGFRDYARRSQPNIFPIVANPGDAVLEELRDLLGYRRQALVCCEMIDDKILRPRVEGVLEEKQIVTLDAVLAAGETDAGSLAEQFASTEKISSTGWSNRLASLAAEGIIVEARSGRAKRYRPVVEGLKRGA
jgi:hypothetical protein